MFRLPCDNFKPLFLDTSPLYYPCQKEVNAFLKAFAGLSNKSECREGSGSNTFSKSMVSWCIAGGDAPIFGGLLAIGGERAWQP